MSQGKSALIYADGSEILVGDEVRIEQGRTPGVVVDVITAERTAELGVAEPGVMIESAPQGLVYVPASRFAQADVRFAARAKPRRVWS